MQKTRQRFAHCGPSSRRMNCTTGRVRRASTLLSSSSGSFLVVGSLVVGKPSSSGRGPSSSGFPPPRAPPPRQEPSSSYPRVLALLNSAGTPSTVVVGAVRTRITSLFQCRYPIVLPGMSWISQPELVAAVSNAGGVGILATGPLSAQETRASIRQIRLLTDQPFGIGATLLMPGAKENAAVALEEQVPIINVSLGKAEWVADGVHSYGGKLLSTVTNAQHAASAVQAGADALLVTGHEAAAHGGDVTSLVLIPSLRAQFPNTPLVAAGGFANGAGLAAALTLGADAVAMGSRLAVTAESPLAQPAKDAIVQATESDTIYGSKFDGIPARVLKTPRAEKLMARRPLITTTIYRAFQAAQQLNMPLWKVLPGLLTQWNQMYMIAQFGAATQALTKSTVEGYVQDGVQFVGQSQGMIQDIPPVNELVQRIMLQAQETLLEKGALFDNDENEGTSSSSSDGVSSGTGTG